MNESFDDYFYKMNGYYPAAHAGKQYVEWLQQRLEELAKLLAEAKSKTVPEGWKLVPKEPTTKMIHYWSCKASIENFDPDNQKQNDAFRARYKAMLASAPQPGGSND